MANTKDIVSQALESWNQNNNYNFSYGQAWVPKAGSEFERFVNNYLYPKVTESKLVFNKLGNRYEFLAREVEDIGAVSEEYVLLDSVPTDLNLTSELAGLFKEAFPRIASMYYGQGRYKVLKFTFDNTVVRQGWSTVGDGINYALKVLAKKLSDINVAEEKEMKGSIVNYCNQFLDDKLIIKTNTMDSMINAIWLALLNLQNPSEEYNETDKIVAQDVYDRGGADELILGRYTTSSNLNDLLIITTDELKVYLLGTKIANTFANEGLDISNHIISHDKFGGVFSINEDITITEPRTLAYLKGIGYFDLELGQVLKAGRSDNKTLITFDPTPLNEFKNKVTEIDFENKNNALVIDINALRYLRTTKGMISEPFENKANRRTEHFIHYKSQKIVSPFYNKRLITLED